VAGLSLLYLVLGVLEAVERETTYDAQSRIW